MQKYLKYSIILLILIFVGLSATATLMGALPVIYKANPVFFAVASLFFLFSVVFWVIPWALLLKKRRKFKMLSAIVLGFSCFYGALTPLQVGSEALRAIKAKEFLGATYSESVSAAMIVKGMKFFFLALLASIVVAIVLLETKLSALMVAGLFSGFVVIVLAALLFLLPLNKKIGLKIALLFKKLSRLSKHFLVLEKYFFNYSHYLKEVSRKHLFLVLLMSAISFGLEFLALLFSFYSLGVFISIVPIAILFVIVSILEHAPFLPRGIILVETAGVIFLSTLISLNASQVGAIIILFDVVRLIIPTVVSLGFGLIKIEKTKN